MSLMHVAKAKSMTALRCRVIAQVCFILHQTFLIPKLQGELSVITCWGASMISCSEVEGESEILRFHWDDTAANVQPNWQLELPKENKTKHHD